LVIGWCALLAVSANASADAWFPLRNQNPFLQIFGLPAFEGAYLAGNGESRFRVALDIANHADFGSTQGETIVIDGESYYLDVAYRKRLFDWLELGIDVPLVSHRSGFLDNAIESWHDFLGLSNGKRQGSANQLAFSYIKQDIIDFQLGDTATGLGDVRLMLAAPLRTPRAPDGFAVTLRSVIKLPTGDADRLLGSGATDYSLALHASAAHFAGLENINLAGFAGMLWAGDSDYFAAIQENRVPFAGGALGWQVARRFELLGQLYTQGRLFASELDELAGKSVQMALGANFRPDRARIIVTLGFVEDVVGDTTPDFAVHLSIRSASENEQRP